MANPIADLDYTFQTDKDGLGWAVIIDLATGKEVTSWPSKPDAAVSDSREMLEWLSEVTP